MNYSIFKISLDLHDLTSKEILPIKQDDTGRMVYINVTDNGVPYQITKGSMVTLKIRLPNGSVIYDVCSLEDDTIVYKLTSGVTSIPGVIECEVNILFPSFEEISLPSFEFMNYGTLYKGEIPQASDDFPALEKALIEASNLNISATQREDGYTVSFTDKKGNITTVVLKNGISIEKIERNSVGEIVITYTDGTTDNIGDPFDEMKEELLSNFSIVSGALNITYEESN